MTIGELLKEYRISQVKNQKEFINGGNIISQSYYSKVEKNTHRINADSLIELLHYNNIPVTEFFNRLNKNDDLRQHQIDKLNNTLGDAFYHNDRDKILKLVPIINESDLSTKEKQEELLLIQAWLELMKGPDEQPDLKLREKIKEKIFNIPNLNYAKVTLFCNFMKFYDIESDKTIGKKIIEQHINTTNNKWKIAMLATIVNILAFSLKNGQENDVTYFIKSGEKIETKPELVFYKSAFYFFKNLINYR
ncbi:MULTISPECIES: helix-turn-helix domain-containing protein [Lactobacillus]|uniref:helix-turn-helix domain-containing protein n=1 Tax=Lactobacillus TaxID=1578 RepID=UPI001F1FFBA8|nr:MULTISPECIES: Rgg/GadR/MutR family transcriptional regulator [Lactobacillus]